MLTQNEVYDRLSFPVIKSGQIKFDTFDPRSESILKVPIPDRNVVYNPETLDIFSIVSDKYKIIPHKQVLDSVFTGLDGQEHSIQSLHIKDNGARFDLHIQLPESYPIAPGGDDIQAQIIATNSYNGETGLRLDMGAFRLVCSNGMRIGKAAVSVHKKHYHFNYNDITQTFTKQTEYFRKEVVPFIKECAQAKISTNEGLALIAKFNFSNQQKEDIAYEWTAYQYQTLWSLYNSITYVATWMVNSYTIRERMQRAAWGMMEEIRA